MENELQTNRLGKETTLLHYISNYQALKFWVWTSIYKGSVSVKSKEITADLQIDSTPADMQTNFFCKLCQTTGVLQKSRAASLRDQQLVDTAKDHDVNVKKAGCASLSMPLRPSSPFPAN